jgi:hypothetical protein
MWQQLVDWEEVSSSSEEEAEKRKEESDVISDGPGSSEYETHSPFR